MKENLVKQLQWFVRALCPRVNVQCGHVYWIIVLWMVMYSYGLVFAGQILAVS